MESLPNEILDLICQFVTLRDLSQFSLSNKKFYHFVQEDQFYSYCKKSFDPIIPKYIYALMKNVKFFKRFYCLCKKNNKYNVQFRSTYVAGHLAVAEWLKVEYPDMNITLNFYRNDELHQASIDNNKTFHWTCTDSHMKISRWLQKKYPKICVRSKDDHVFLRECKENNLSIKLWATDIIPEVWHPYGIEFTFRYTCTSGNLEVAQ